MKISKFLFGAVALVMVVFFTSCGKDEEKSSTYSLDFDLSFNTTEELASLTTRQYEISTEEGSYCTYTIEGASFSKTEHLSGIKAPNTIYVKVFAGFKGSQVPESVQVKNGHKITIKTADGFVTSSDSGILRTITSAEFADFLEEMNYTVTVKLNKDGSLSK